MRHPQLHHLLCVGSKGNAETRWTGVIDELAVYDKALGQPPAMDVRNDAELAAAANRFMGWGIPIR